MNDRPASNHGVANIGQAKNLAKQALEALRTKDAIAATQVENDLVGPGKIIPSWDVPLTQVQKDAQHLPLLVGQLKAISAPFYKELGAIELPWLNAELVANGTKDHADSTNHYPWTKTTTDDRNKAFATIGQLKAVFSLRFETLPPPPATDLDRDGILDTWETIHGFNPFLRDEDHNGTPDGQDDADGDGSSNTEEQNAGTNPHGTTTTADHVQNFEASQFVLIPLDVPAATGLSDYEVNTITDDGKVLFNLYYIESGDPNDYNISSSFFWQEGISDPDRLDSSFYQPFRMFGRMNRAGYYSYQENFPNPADGRKVFMGHADSPVLSELTIPKFQAELDNQVQAYFQAVYSANWTSYSLERLTSAVVSTVDFHMLEDGSSFGEVWQSSDFRVTGTRATGSPSTAGVDGWATNCLKWIQTGTNGSDPQFFEGAGTLIQRSFLSQEFVNLAGAGGMGEDGFCVIRKIDHSGPQVTGQVTNSLRNRSGAIIKQFDEEESDQVYLPATSCNGHVAQSGSTGVSRYHAISGGMEVLPPSIQGHVAGVNDQGDVLVSSAAAPQAASPDRLVRSFLDDASGETTWAQCVFSDDKLPDGWSDLNVQALANSLPLSRQRVLESEGTYPPAPEKAPIPLVAGTAMKAGKEYPVLMVPVKLITDMNNDGKITSADNLLRDAAMASGVTDEIKDKGTEFIFHNDTLSNGIWDTEDTDPAKPAAEKDDDDAEEITIIPGIPAGEVWLEHPAIQGLSFYKTRECNPADKISLTSASRFRVSSTNPFPEKLFMRADGTLNYPEENPQFEGNLVLKVRIGLDGEEIEALKMKLTVVKQFGAKKYFHTARDYILENNTKTFTQEKEYGASTKYRIVAMREESTFMYGLDTYDHVADAPRLRGIDEVKANYASDVIINGNQCFFHDDRNVYLAAIQGQMTNRCEGRLCSAKNILRPPSDDIHNPNLGGPGARYVGYTEREPNIIDGQVTVPSKFDFATGQIPEANAATPDHGVGGLAAKYDRRELQESENQVIGRGPAIEQGKGVFFTATTYVGNAGNAVDLAADARKSGVKPLSGGDGSQWELLFLDGSSSVGLVLRDPGGHQKTMIKGGKHTGAPYYYINTYLLFECQKARN